MEFINQLKKRLKEPLPGYEAQLKMMSLRKAPPKKTNSYFNPLENAKKASVMLLLFKKENVWHTVLMERSESPYVHSKQISFPGGGLEESDASLLAGALRETEEEFGISPQDIEPIGALSELYIPISRYLVYPFVGYLKAAPIYKPDPREVAAIIEVKIDDLFNPALRKITDMPTSAGVVFKNMPYFDLNNKVVWGATAMMLSEFVAVVESLKV